MSCELIDNKAQSMLHAESLFPMYSPKLTQAASQAIIPIHSSYKSRLTKI